MATGFVIYPRPAGGGGADSASPAEFSQWLKTAFRATDIDAKLSVPYAAYVWQFPSKFQKIHPDFFLGNSVLVMSCFIIFCQKQQMFECFYNVHFWSKTQSKNVNGRNLHALQNIDLVFLYFSISIHSSIQLKSNYDFTKINALKIENFADIQKTTYDLKIQ